MIRTAIHISFVCALFIIFSPFEDTHWPKWASFHLLIAVWLGVWYAGKHHWTVGFLLFTTILSGARAFSIRDLYSNLHLVEQVDLSSMAAKATLAFVLLLMVAERLSLPSIMSLLNSYIVVCLGHCLYVLWQRYVIEIGYNQDTGFLPNVSMGPSMLAILFPLALWWWWQNRDNARKTLYATACVLFLTIIYLHQSSIPYAALVAGVATLAACVLVQVYGWSRVLPVVLIGVVLAIMAGGYFDKDWFTFYETPRFKYWPLFMRWWWENSPHWLGSGTGTFRHMGPIIQYRSQQGIGEWWIWIHNDWLQVLFETGYIGVLSALSLLLTAIMRAYRSCRFELVAALVALVVVSAGNYPLRLAEFSFLVMLLLAAAMKLQHPERPINWKLLFSNSSKSTAAKR